MRTASGYLSLLWDLAHGRATRGHMCLDEGERLVRLWAVPFGLVHAGVELKP